MAGPVVVPVCAGCRCRNRSGHRAWLCDRCRPGGGSTWEWTTRTHIRKWSCPNGGPGHAERYGIYCEDCHPLAWREAKPCEGCARSVANHVTVRPGYRRGVHVDPDGTVWVTDETGYGWVESTVSVVRTFCSEHCRRTVLGVEQKARRLAARGERARQCVTCKVEFKPARSDARYCSPACRQRAYRQRKGEA